MNCYKDYQIFQRDDDGFARVTVSGKLPEGCPENSEVRATVYREDDHLVIINSKKGNSEGMDWSVELVIPEGGLYYVEVSGPAPFGLIKFLRHIGVGDIYVACGQSNMEGNGIDCAYDPSVIGVHEYLPNGDWAIAAHPLGVAENSLYKFVSVNHGTSPSLSFARMLKERLGVPIGIVQAAVGGTKLERWNPDEIGDCGEEMYKRIDAVGNFKGFLWCQGCSDATYEEAPTYFDRFSNMVGHWRKKYGHRPVIMIQINRHAERNTNDIPWGMVSDAQRRAAIEIDDVYSVPSIDQTTSDGIHNSSSSNVVLGERMASVALYYIYKKLGQPVPMVIKAEMPDDTHVHIVSNTGGNIIAMDNRAFGMNVEDENGIIECDEAIRVRDGLWISTARPYTLPAKFHYAWKRTETPPFYVQDWRGIPMLACYGVEIEPMDKNKSW